MARDRLIADVVSALYSTVLDPSRWEAALASIVQLADARAANCFVEDLVNGQIVEYRYTGYGELAASRYVSHYSQIDLAYQALIRQGTGIMIPLNRHVPDALVARSEFYQDFYIPEGLRFACGGTLQQGMRRIVFAVHRPVGHMPYEDAEAAELGLVLKHLSSVIKLSDLAFARNQHLLVAASALQSLPTSVFVVDARCEVRYVNAAAEQLMASDPALCIQAKRLRMRSSEETSALLRMVTKACGSVCDLEPAPMYLKMAKGEAFIELRVIPIEPEASASFPANGAFAMVIARKLMAVPRTSQFDGRPFNLSAGEWAIVQGLIEGLTPSELAERQGIKIATVRSHIQSILGKTELRRITEVVGLFSGLCQ